MICTFWLENLWKYSTIVTHTFHSFFQVNLIGHRYGGGGGGVLKMMFHLHLLFSNVII